MKRQLLTACALLAGSTPALAQSSGYIGHFAAAQTPVLGLAPMLTNTLINRLQNGGSLAIRAGFRPADDGLLAGTFSAAATGILPAGLGATFRITGGVQTPDCSGCDPQLMLGLGGDMRLMGARAGAQANSSFLTVSLDGELGYGNGNGSSAIAGSVGLPVALVPPRGNGMQLAPFLMPMFVFGRSSEGGGSESGSAFAIAGGLGLFNLATNVTVNVGGQYSFVNGSQSMVGLNVMLGGK